jgi:hypothetical protein
VRKPRTANTGASFGGNSLFAEIRLAKYVEKRFTLRVCKKDGTAKLLAGMSSAGGVYIGKLIKIPVGKDDVLMAQITASPKALDEPWEATEVSAQQYRRRAS